MVMSEGAGRGGAEERNEMIKHVFPRRKRGCDCGIIPQLGGSCRRLCTFICCRTYSVYVCVQYGVGVHVYVCCQHWDRGCLVNAAERLN